MILFKNCRFVKELTEGFVQEMGDVLVDDKGTICVGKNAELVVIDGKPDIDINDMKQMPRYVYFHGELIEN